MSLHVLSSIAFRINISDIHPGSIRNRYFFMIIPEHFGLLYPPTGSIRNRIIRPSCNGDEVRKHALYEKSSERVGLPRFHLGLVLGGIFIKCFVFNMNSLEGLKMKIMLSNFISKIYNTKYKSYESMARALISGQESDFLLLQEFF